MTERPNSPDRTDEQPRVLLIDSDADVTDVVVAILTDEGYEVRTVNTTDHRAIAAEVNRYEPDCVLLDSAARPGYGQSWDEAAYLSSRERAIPTVMFTAHSQDADEAREGETDRARRADFAAVLAKPFNLDELLDAVATACDRSQPFEHGHDGERARTLALARRLRARGATDVRTSNRREWATFASSHDERIYQLYWWQQLGLYIVGRYDADARLEIVGQFYELDAAIESALSSAADLPSAAAPA
ncbi:MAG TPA: response regulator [Candidatus Limnocylindria bacterium]